MPHIRGFPLLGWQLARAESTSRPALRPVQSGQSELCVVAEHWRHHAGTIHRIRYTTVIGSRCRDGTIRDRRDVEEMPRRVATAMHGSEQQDHLIVQEGRPTVSTPVIEDSHLNASDRCDRCGAQAYVRVTMASGFDLLFCSHHSKEHADKLKQVALTIHDETETIR